jgi:hypothetical protein
MKMVQSSHLINPHIRIDRLICRISTGVHSTDDDSPKQAGICRDIELLYTERRLKLFAIIGLSFLIASKVFSLPVGRSDHNPVREDK